MKTKELLKWVDNNKYTHEELDDKILIYKEDLRIPLVLVMKEEHEFHYYKKTIDVEDFNLLLRITEYINTPIEERKEGKYYLRPTGMVILEDKVYGYIKDKNVWNLINKESTYYKVQFTKDELKELGIQIEHFNLVPVK